MKVYYFDKKFNTIKDHLPDIEFYNYYLNEDRYIALYGRDDDSVFIDTYRIGDTNQVIDFAYSRSQIPDYEQYLKYHLNYNHIDIDNVVLIRRTCPKDWLIELLTVYNIAE